MVLNKPVYTGMTILENSKILMSEFYYNFLKNEYGDRCELFYTDTDSLLLEIETEDVYADVAQNIELYDTSDYPPSHPLYSSKNKKVLGKMKDEMAGEPIAEVVCLRPKMYFILLADDIVLKKAKGVKKNVVKKEIRHEHYKETLFNGTEKTHSMNILRSKKHEIYGMRVTKTSLSPFDTKRWIEDDGVNTRAFGYNPTLTEDDFASTMELFEAWERNIDERGRVNRSAPDNSPFPRSAATSLTTENNSFSVIWTSSLRNPFSRMNRRSITFFSISSSKSLAWFASAVSTVNT